MASSVSRRRKVLVLLLIALSIAILTVRNMQKQTPELPLQFRFSAQELNDLPVLFEDVRSCGCWKGPDQQAERKFKFRIVNNSSDAINIAGGVSSQIRLIVAYPHSPPSSVRQPVSDGVGDRYVGTPADVAIDTTSTLEEVPVNRLTLDNEELAVPSDWSVIGIPPNFNKTAYFPEDSDIGGFPTYVEKSVLQPDETYSDDRLGFGAWVFEIPLPPGLVQGSNFAGLELIVAREEYMDEMIIVGLALFGADGSLRGFSPAPSDDVLMDPLRM